MRNAASRAACSVVQVGVHDLVFGSERKRWLEKDQGTLWIDLPCTNPAESLESIWKEVHAPGVLDELAGVRPDPNAFVDKPVADNVSSHRLL
jgi:hypothetical protein